MRILLATDAWEPQVNGVVRTLTRVVAELREMGDEVEVISPDQFATFPLPTYPEIKLAMGAQEKVRQRFKAFEPEAIHIATEGPLGPRRAADLPGVEAAVHHQLPHAVPGICLGPAAAAARRRLRLHALVPQAVGPADGGHADHARRA